MHRNPLSIKTACEQTSLIEIIHVIQLSNNSKLLCSALLQQQKENQRQDYFYLTRDAALAKIWIIIYFPHITFIYYKNIQIYCINIFLILNNKIHIGF